MDPTRGFDPRVLAEVEKRNRRAGQHLLVALHLGAQNEPRQIPDATAVEDPIKLLQASDVAADDPRGVAAGVLLEVTADDSVAVTDAAGVLTGRRKEKPGVLDRPCAEDARTRPDPHGLTLGGRDADGVELVARRRRQQLRGSGMKQDSKILGPG
jgi:hypothetical protein